MGLGPRAVFETFGSLEDYSFVRILFFLSLLLSFAHYASILLRLANDNTESIVFRTTLEL